MSEPTRKRASATLALSFRVAGDRSWPRAARTTERMAAAWEIYRGRHRVPSLLEMQMNDALGVLERTVRAKDGATARQASIDVGTATLDLQLQYRSQDSVDADRLMVWRKQLQLDAATGDAGAIAGDKVTSGAIQARINQ